MIRKRQIGIYLKSGLIAGTLLIFACNKDEEIASVSKNDLPGSDFVTFGINLTDCWAPDVLGEGDEVPQSAPTRGSSATRTKSLPMDCEGEAPATEILMYMIEEDMPESSDSLMIATRAGGTEETASEGTAHIGIIAYHHVGESTLFMDNINLSTYGLTGGTEYKYWPGGDGTLDFYAYMPYLTKDVKTNGLTLTIGNPTPSFTYTVPTDLTKQLDIMEGASKGVEANSLQTVNISLNHIMSKIQVKVGTMEEGVIQSVSFKNIYSTGTRTLAAEEGEEGEDVAKGWIVDNTNTQDYTQSWGSGLAIPTDGDKMIGDPMYLMPQTLSENAQIEIVLTVTSTDPAGTDSDAFRTNTYTLTKNLSDFTPTWSENKQYTFVISTPEEVELEVNDVVEGNVKKDLTITNTGLSNLYVRASIVGNWIIPGDSADPGTASANDIVMASWDYTNTNEGIFNWGDDNGKVEPSSSAKSGWYKHTDGFYYHLNVVKPGEQTATLFETYTVGTSPVPGAILELIIVTQAVLASDVGFIWPIDKSMLKATSFEE